MSVIDQRTVIGSGYSAPVCGRLIPNAISNGAGASCDGGVGWIERDTYQPLICICIKQVTGRVSKTGMTQENEFRVLVVGQGTEINAADLVVRCAEEITCEIQEVLTVREE